LDIAVELEERSGIAELLGALAGEQLARVRVLRDRRLRAVVLGLVAELLEPLELLAGRVVRPLLSLCHPQGA